MQGAGHDRGDGGPRARSQWRVRVQAGRDDLGTTLVEALAWAADRLSYFGERLADEAYLSGARRGVAQPRRPRAESGIVINVDGTRLRQVPNFGGSGPDDQHYIVRHDVDGATVVEFGDGVHGRRPSSGSSIAVRYRDGARYSFVLLQQGWVILDADVAETPPVMMCGICRGTVTENADPLGPRRLRVQVPGVNGDHVLWAVACLPSGGVDQTPSIGDDVWVAFESGDPALPVWMGRLAASPCAAMPRWHRTRSHRWGVERPYPA